MEMTFNVHNLVSFTAKHSHTRLPLGLMAALCYHEAGGARTLKERTPNVEEVHEECL